MGIRIKKLMGYSLSLEEIGDKICAPNMEWNCDEFLESERKWEEMCKEILDVQGRYSGDDWKKSPFTLERMYLEMVRDGDKSQGEDYVLDNLRTGMFYKFITYDNEFGDADTVLIRPLLSPKDWSRYDDAIDYIEANLQGHNGEPKVIRHNRTLYPFTNLMRKNPDSYMGIEEYWEPCYLDKPKFKEAIPTCTYSVMLILKYMGLVPEDRLADAVMLLRPTVYSYWC